MTDDDITHGEIQRRLDHIDTSITDLTTSIGDLKTKLVADYYRITDVDKRLSRLEKLLAGVIAAIIGILIDILVGQIA